MLKFRMSKEKPVTSGSSMRGRYSYKISRTLSAGIPGEDPPPIEKAVPTKRVCLGGRGREWAAESLKLLETISSSDDAKLFLEPMNPLKYPEYYNMVREPIDLSKIMLKFHGGSYPGLFHFSEDMHLMFDNYKRFFKDSSNEAYHQVRRLCTWFDAELDRIKTRWYRICDNGSRVVTGATNGYTPRPGSLDARIQAIEAENRRIVNLAAKPQSIPIRLAPMDQRQVKLPQVLNAVSLSSNTGAGTSQGNMNRPVLAFRLADGGAISSSSSLKLPGAGNSQPIIIMSKSSGENGSASTQAGLMYMCAGWPKQSVLKPIGSVGSGATLGMVTTGTPRTAAQVLGSILPKVVPPAAVSPKNSPEGAGLMLDVGNVWFGTAMNQPIEPVTIDEKGLHFVLKNGEQETPFTIGCDEVIKCAAYFGNIRKHTLFLFVLPNCVRRLCSLGEEFTLSSLIIMFPRALSQSQIAKLVYLFWRMSRVSMFGDLFCEIDQKSALALLGNIRPTAVSNMANKYNDALGNDVVDTRPASNAVKQVVIGQCVPQNGAAVSVSVAAASNDPGNEQFICDTAEAFGVDCKLEPVDEEPEEVLSTREVGSNFIKLGLSSIVDNKCLTLAENLLSNETVEDSRETAVDGVSKSDVIRKRLKIRYRPGILKHAKRRKTEEKHPPPRQTNQEEEEVEEEEEAGSRSSDLLPREEECDNQFTIIEWFPDDNALPAEEQEEDESVASENSQSIELPRIPGSKDENDLEIVAPAIDSDAEMDIGVSCNTSVVGENGEGHEELVVTGEEDLVMTGEKINIRCPITQQIMEYPVKNIHCNHLYDKQGVEDLIKHRGEKAKCPVTGCSNALRLQMKDVQHDSQLSFYIQQKLSQMASR